MGYEDNLYLYPEEPSQLDHVVRKRKKGKNGSSGRKGGSKFGKKGFGGKARKDHIHDSEVKEMWDIIAGGDSEDDNDTEPEGEDDEVNNLFKAGRKKKKNERSAEEIALLVENVMAELEVAAEEDVELNRQGKPAINKLMKLHLLEEVLAKKQLQLDFLDHGVLTLLKNWLEPLPDGSLPNIYIRTTILKILNDFPVDLEQYDRREQLKKSGLGKGIMFLSRFDEEINVNRKLAKDLVDKWSRPIFNKSTWFEDMRGVESRGCDLDFEFSQSRSGQSYSSQHASRPEATPLDFIIRPQSKVDPEARAKQASQNQQRINKKLQQLRAQKMKQLQAIKLSAEGRGMVKYL